MTGRRETVPDAERRRAANVTLTNSMEEVCRHYAPSGSRAGDCWEVRAETGAVTLRVFLAGPMRGLWTDAATDGRGDALDLVAHLCGLDAAGALAEAERFLDRESTGPERKAGDAGDGQMGLFETLPESRGRKQPARRSGKGRKAGASRRAAETGREPPAGGAASRPGDGPAGTGDTADGPQASPEVPAPKDGRTEPPPPDPAPDARPGADKSGTPASVPDGVWFTAEDRQRIRQSAEDSAWIRKHLTVRSPDDRAHERAKARKDGHGRRRRRSGLKAAGIVAVVMFGPFAGVMGENRYGIAELVAVYGAELPKDAAVPLPDGGG